MIAEISSNYSAPLGFAAWAGCLFFTVALVNPGLKLCDRITGKKKELSPQPFVVQGTPASNAEMQRDLKSMNHRLKSLEDWRGQLSRQMEENKTEVLTAGEERASRIYKHVEEVRREIDGKISALPNEIVALLKNTGAIGGKQS